MKADTAQLAVLALAGAILVPGLLGAGALATDRLGLLQDLSELCAHPASGLSPECRSALERRYSDMPVGTKGPGIDGGVGTPYRNMRPGGITRRIDAGEWWLPPSRSPGIAWGELFDDAGSIRERVEAAVQRPECLVPAGRTRHDLRDSCDAGAMVGLSLLLDTCLPLRFPSDATAWSRRWDLVFADLAAKYPDDSRLEGALWDYRLHFAWRLQRCEEVPLRVFVLMRSLPLPRGNGQELFLRQLAARLGDLWTYANFGRDPAEINAAAAADPVVGFVERAEYALLESDRGEALSFLLAAEVLDGRHPDSAFDWGGLQAAYTAEEVVAAAALKDRILSSGVEPLEETEPYRVGETGDRRHWVGADGREWIEGRRGEAVEVVSHGFLGRCGVRGKKLGYLKHLSGNHGKIDMSMLAPVGMAKELEEASDDRVRRWIGSDGTECAMAADGTVVAEITAWGSE